VGNTSSTETATADDSNRHVLRITPKLLPRSFNSIESSTASTEQGSQSVKIHAIWDLCSVSPLDGAVLLEVAVYRHALHFRLAFLAVEIVDLQEVSRTQHGIRIGSEVPDKHHTQNNSQQSVTIQFCRLS
jgi:hypothetical protein